MIKYLTRSKSITIENPITIGLVIGPYDKEGRGSYILKSNLIKVFNSIIEHNTFISKIELVGPDCRIQMNRMPLRLIKIFIIQLKYIYNMVRLCKNDTIFIFIMGPKFFPSILTAKLFNKKIVYFISGLTGVNTFNNVMSILYKKSFFGITLNILPSILTSLEKFNYKLADLLVVESSCLEHQLKPDNSNNKPIFNGALFVDTNIFRPTIKLSERTNTVSYIGFISEHKGITNFIESIPIILNKMHNVKFFVGGTGPLLHEIKIKLNKMQLVENADIVLYGQIAHKDIPDHLNKAKLIVLPSYGEGLPNIVLEAMACGTPVLATRVGGILDLIIDGQTGFLMDNNSSECIAANVIRALEHPNLEGIAKCAQTLVEQEFVFEKAMERWIKILMYANNYNKSW